MSSSNELLLYPAQIRGARLPLLSNRKGNRMDFLVLVLLAKRFSGLGNVKGTV
jgi:hypothetical protein